MIEIDDFKELITNHKENYIDKSLCIPYPSYRLSEIIFKPPKFGKSVYLSMLNYFFNIDYHSKDLFKDLQIMKEDEEKLQFLNKIPTIYLSFKDCTATTYSGLEDKIKKLMSQAFQSYPYLKTSPKLNSYDQEEYQNGLSQENRLVDMSLFHLTHLLSKHHGQEVMVLIDDIDIPLLSGLHHNYSSEANSLIINMLASANHKPSYVKTFIGMATIVPNELIIKLSHAGFRFNSLIQPNRLNPFGFTKEEVTKLLTNNHLQDKIEEVQAYYGGYNLDLIKNIFNPGSIIQYLTTKKLQPYLRKIDMKYPKLSNEDLTKLLNGEELTVDISHDIWQYHDLDRIENPYVILIFLGYLTYCGELVTDDWGDTKIDYKHYKIKIPKKEIMTIIKNS